MAEIQNHQIDYQSPLIRVYFRASTNYTTKIGIVIRAFIILVDIKEVDNAIEEVKHIRAMELAQANSKYLMSISPKITL